MSADIRFYINLVEGAWALSYQYAYRSWYNTHTGDFVKVGAFGSHAKDAVKEPEKYGQDFSDIDPDSVIDRDPRVLDRMCKAGWIRVAGADRNNPNRAMIIEGDNLDQMKKLAKRFFSDMDGKLENLTLKVRSGDGHAGQEYALSGAEQIKATLLRKADLPAPYDLTADDEMAA